MRNISTSRLGAGRVVLGALVGLLALAGAAFAAHRVSSHAVRHHTVAANFERLHQKIPSVLIFRVSRNGRTMQLTGRTTFTLTCRRNGQVTGSFQAVLVQGKTNADTATIPAPLITISRNGTFYGVGLHRFTPGAAQREALHSAQRETLRYHFAGHVTGHGKTAVGRFFANNCSSAPFHAALSLASTRHALAASPGLVAAYAFDEGSGTTVTDASGNGNNGTITNATWSTSGKYGDALSFNGTNALVTIPNSASLQLSSGMTLEAWVNPSDGQQQLARRDLQGQRQLLSRGDLVELFASGRRA